MPGMQTYVTRLEGNINLIGDCDCDPLWEDVFSAISEKLKVITSTFAPPCGYGTIRMESRRPACYKYISDELGKRYVSCVGPAFCVFTCDLCYTGAGTFQTFNVTWTTEGDPGCNTPPDPWESDPNTCYRICDAH